MLRLALVAVLVIACMVATARAAPLEGEFAEGEARLLSADARGAVLSVRFERCGQFVRSEWRGRGGALIAADELESGAESQFARYRYWRPNVAESGTVIRNGRRARIEITSSGERRVREVDAPTDLTLGPMLALRAEQNLRDLRRGKPFVIDYLVPDRFMVLRFSMATPARAPSDVHVSPTSWLVRQTLEPMRFVFDAQGTFVGLRGRALPLAGTPQRKEPMPLELRLDHRFRAACVPEPGAQPPMLAAR
jgi:hypothetical protein